VKRKDLIRAIEALGSVFDREGGNHTLYKNPRTRGALPVPRHGEINERLAKKIIKDAEK
jgi:mRNA interferase HicA